MSDFFWFRFCFMLTCKQYWFSFFISKVKTYFTINKPLTMQLCNMYLGNSNTLLVINHFKYALTLLLQQTLLIKSLIGWLTAIILKFKWVNKNGMTKCQNKQKMNFIIDLSVLNVVITYIIHFLATVLKQSKIHFTNVATNWNLVG